MTRPIALLCGLALSAAAIAQDDARVKQCVAQFPPGAARAQCVTPWLDDIVLRRSAGKEAPKRSIFSYFLRARRATNAGW